VVAAARDLQRIEQRLRGVLGSYSQARFSSDYLEALLGVHGALDEAFDAHLAYVGRGRRDIGRLSFAEKAGEVLPPEALDSVDVDELGRRCREYARPTQPVEGEGCREAADQIASFALAVWEDLFAGSAPDLDRDRYVSVPGDALSYTQLSELNGELTRLRGQRDVLSAKLQERDAEIERLHTRLAGQSPVLMAESARSKIRWSALCVALLSPLPMAWLAGFSEQLWRETLAGWYWLTIPAVAVLALSSFIVHGLWHFLCSAGAVRVVATLGVLLMITTLVAMPFTDKELPWPRRAGAALTRVLSSTGAAAEGLVSFFVDSGAAIATRSLSLGFTAAILGHVTAPLSLAR
jgi:hypothetical protein